MHIWQQLAKRKQPILALSPMDGITNSPLRQIVKKYGTPDIMFTEFANVEGLHFAKQRLLPILSRTSFQDPVIAQIYGLKPEYFYEATLLVCELGFAGVDINMGCPAKSVVHSGAGASLIKNPSLAQEIVMSVAQASQDYAKQHAKEALPVSIKTRLGYNSDTEMEDWLGFLLTLKPAAISLHGRTLKQGYGGQANWQKIAQAVSLAQDSHTLILGGGDVKSFAQAQIKIKESGVAGVLIGRAVLGNPFVFKPHQPSAQELAQVAVDHAQVYEELTKDWPKSNFQSMRTHLAAYIHSFPNASEIRSALVRAENANQVAKILSHLL